MPTVAFNICCPRDCVSRHNGGTSGAPLKPLRDDSALRALSSLRGLRGAPEVHPLCRETSVSRTANVGTVGMNGLSIWAITALGIKYSRYGTLYPGYVLLRHGNACYYTLFNNVA